MTDREMILSPYKWPHFYLPLKRRRKGWLPEVAILRTATNDPTAVFIVDEGMTIFGPLDCPIIRHEYQGVDAVLADDWLVD